MSFRELPSSVDRVLVAARRLHPAHGLYVSVAPTADGPPWEFHPFKRWLVLRTEDPKRILEAVACSLLARTAWLGKGTVTAVPESLNKRYVQVLGSLLAVLGEKLEATEARS